MNRLRDWWAWLRKVPGWLWGVLIALLSLVTMVTLYRKLQQARNVATTERSLSDSREATESFERDLNDVREAREEAITEGHESRVDEWSDTVEGIEETHSDPGDELDALGDAWEGTDGGGDDK